MFSQEILLIGYTGAIERKKIMSFKSTKVIVLMLSLVLVLVGCSSKDEQRNLTKIPESQNLLVTGNRPLGKDQIGKKLGEVKKAVNPDAGADLADWDSTNLPVGTEIYQVLGEIDNAKGDYFAYKKDGKFYLFYEFFERK